LPRRFHSAGSEAYLLAVQIDDALTTAARAFDLLPRAHVMNEAMTRYARALGAHCDDRIVTGR
jgi:hypothetical protein